ncbi:Monocarboxylate 2-oxoacid-binding periplasmic protein [bacterium HR40]|nr:Monocarboxylate 2-oxoacid-binding periplasmic protein [bacterium HR40]
MTTLSRRRALTALAASGVAAPAVVRGATPARWRMVTSWPRNLPGPGVTAQRLADRIARASGGRIRVELFAAGELVPAFEVLDAVAGGVAELAHTAAVFWMGKIPAAAFFLAIPFGLTPLEHMAWIDHGGGQQLWDELYADLGVKPFMAGNTGMSMGGWFRKEIHSLSDLRGLRFRMPGLGGEMYRPFGIVQVSLPPGETLPALQTGAIDAAEFAGPASDLALGFYKVAPYYYWPGLHEPNGTGECIVNRAVWEGLDDELKAVVAHACAAENAYALAESERANAEALKVLVHEHGVQLRRFPDEVIAAARHSAREVIARFDAAGGIEARIYRSYVAMLERLGDWPRVSVQGFLEARHAA